METALPFRWSVSKSACSALAEVGPCSCHVTGYLSPCWISILYMPTPGSSACLCHFRSQLLQLLTHIGMGGLSDFSPCARKTSNIMKVDCIHCRQTRTIMRGSNTSYYLPVFFVLHVSYLSTVHTRRQTSFIRIYFQELMVISGLRNDMGVDMTESCRLVEYLIFGNLNFSKNLRQISEVVIQPTTSAPNEFCSTTRRSGKIARGCEDMCREKRC